MFNSRPTPMPSPFKKTLKYSMAQSWPGPRFWVMKDNIYQYFVVEPKVLEKCPGLRALSTAASVPAWSSLPFGIDKVSAFEVALHWKILQLDIKDLQRPFDDETDKMVAFLDGVE